MATKRLCKSGSDAARASFKYSTARSQYSRALVQLRSSSSASNRLSDNNSTLFQTERFWLYPCSAICPLARHPSDVRTDILRWTLFFARSIMRGVVVAAEIFEEARL